MSKDIAEHLADFLVTIQSHPAAYRKACMRMWREAYGEKIAAKALSLARAQVGKSRGKE